MATIRERKSRFTAIIRKAGHPPVTKTFSSRRNAEQWARRIESSIEQSEVVETGRHALAEAIERYRNDSGQGARYKREELARLVVEAIGRAAHVVVASIRFLRGARHATQDEVPTRRHDCTGDHQSSTQRDQRCSHGGDLVGVDQRQSRAYSTSN